MLKKTLAAAGLAGLLVLGGAAAATADTYPPVANITASDVTPVPGEPTVITVTGIPAEFPEVIFSVTGPGPASIASIVPASAGSASVTKPVTDGTATATFTASTEGTYSVTVIGPPDTVLAEIALTVAAGGGSTPGGDAGAGDGLANTGGALPATALWLGLGAVGIGGIAVAAGVARRRASSH